MKKSILSMALFFVLLFGVSIPVKADTGASFSASTIKAGTAGYGVVDGARNNRFYHLTPGRASIYVSTYNGKGTVTVSLRKGYFSATASTVGTVTVNGTGWYTFYGLTADSQYYSLYIVYYGDSGTSGGVSGSVHDHAGQ